MRLCPGRRAVAGCHAGGQEKGEAGVGRAQPLKFDYPQSTTLKVAIQVAIRIASVGADGFRPSFYRYNGVACGS
jgi:hypothetical protein